MLEVSHSIRAGISSGNDSIFLIHSFVKAFETLVLGCCCLNDYLCPPLKGSNSSKHTGEPPAATGLSSQRTDGSASHDNVDNSIFHDTNNEHVLDKMHTRLVRTEKEFNSAVAALVKAKEEVIILLTSGGRKDLARYQTATADQLITFVLAFLAKGDTGTVTAVDLYRDYCSELVSEMNPYYYCTIPQIAG